MQTKKIIGYIFIIFAIGLVFTYVTFICLVVGMGFIGVAKFYEAKTLIPFIVCSILYWILTILLWKYGLRWVEKKE